MVGRHDHGPAVQIKRSIDDNSLTRDFFDFFEQAVIRGIIFGRNELGPRGSVDMNRGGKRRSDLRFHPESDGHVFMRKAFFKKAGSFRFEHARAERLPRGTPFDRDVYPFPE